MAQPSFVAQASRLTKDLSLGLSPSVTIPKLLYGTAWKKERTEELVYQALKHGFRGIDTAAQPKHYEEYLVAAACKRAVADGLIKREDLFIQTKFTPPAGQGEISAYSNKVPLNDMVHMSVKNSFSWFKAHEDSLPNKYLDSVILHSPLDDFQDTMIVWKALELHYPDKVRSLGISNTSLDTLKALYEHARVKPTIVQNRFHEKTGYEVELREFCRSHGIVFQSFWTLSANPGLAKSPPVVEVAQKANVPNVASYYSLVIGLEGVTILDGTTDEAHMKEDLEGIEKVGMWAEGEGQASWETALADFKHLIGEK